MKVFPVGYSTPDAVTRIDSLMARPEVLLIDTRLKPQSWNDQWKREALQEKYGERYRWAGKYLGNIGYQDGYIEIADIDAGLRGLIGYLYKGHDLILLCQCKEYNKCHVSHIVRHLQEMPDIEVVRDEQELVIPDVVNNDVGETPIPGEYRQLYAEYCAEVDDWVPVATPLWNGLEHGYPPRLLEKDKHKACTRSLLCSGDVKQIEAALEAMKRLLLKWDASSAIAKMNRDAYAAREQKKLRDRSAPIMRAWERECRRNPYYPDKESLEGMKEREERKLMERYQAYQEKWRSNGYAVPELHKGEDGYMVVPMPEGWTRKGNLS